MAPPPFALLTRDLVILPSPWAAEVRPYRTLFRKLHADANFCRTAFGEDFAPIIWSDEDMRSFLLGRDGALRWDVRGMGDFAVGLLPVDKDSGKTAFHTAQGIQLKNDKEEVHKITGDAFETVSSLFDGLEWVGYTCVRDATTAGGNVTEMYERAAGANLPAWQEMIEVRYGMDPDFRGRGIATRAAEIVMAWAVEEFGVRRFIAEVQKPNVGSRRLLGRLGFEMSDTKYFDDEHADEWAKVVVS